MYAANFDYYRATSVDQALQLLREHPGARLLAGGHSLLPQMKLRVAAPPALVDIGRIADLAGVQVDGDHVRIGALTTHDTLAHSPEIKARCAILAEAAEQIGDQQVRNRGTIGGSLAHADPAADLPTVIVALGGTLTAVGPGGQREIPAGEFFKDLFTTALAEGEILTAITVPAYGKGTGGAYLKHPHPASGYAVVGVAALLNMQGANCRGAMLAVGGATANPVRVGAAEAALTGRKLDGDVLVTAAGKVGEALAMPMGDHFASGDYRRHLAAVLARRALAAALDRAKG
jgi:carbon-monoxide dehydrogenase medium subunit